MLIVYDVMSFFEVMLSYLNCWYICIRCDSFMLRSLNYIVIWGFLLLLFLKCCDSSDCWCI